MTQSKQNVKTNICSSLALLTAAFLVASCQTQTRLTPAAGANQVSGLEQAASAELQDIYIVVESQAWTGNLDIEDHVTPLSIEIQNNSDAPLRVRYSDFALVGEEDGKRFAALPPYSVDGSITERSVALYDRPINRVGFTYDRFRVSPFYDGLYPGLRYWRRPFYHDPSYYAFYNEYWLEIPLPTEEMLRNVLPEGVIDPGGSVSGFLYFEEVDRDLTSVEFRYDLTNANNGQRFGMMTIPFLVREE